MKKYIVGILILVGGVVGALVAQTPAAAPTKIAVINLQDAIVRTAEGQAAAAELGKRFIEPRTKELEAKQQEIRDMQERLQRGGNTMSQTAKDDLQRSIDTKTKALNRSIEDYQADREDEDRKLMDDFTAKIQPVIGKYVQDNGIAVVFDAGGQGLVWAANSIDITQPIIEAYDKAHPVAGGAPASSGAAKQPAAPPKQPAAPSKPPAGKQ